MLKGAQKRMIVIKTPDSTVFEEAYFMLRRECAGGEIDMVAEANRIIEECREKREKSQNCKMKDWMRAAVWFLGGGTLGGAMVGLLNLLVG